MDMPFIAPSAVGREGKAEKKRETGQWKRRGSAQRAGRELHGAVRKEARMQTRGHSCGLTLSEKEEAQEEE